VNVVLSVIVFLPAVVAAVLLLIPATAPQRVFTGAWVAVSAVDLALVVAVWLGLEPGGGIQFEERVAWSPSSPARGPSRTTAAWRGGIRPSRSPSPSASSG
jgi:NADH-quinone oxidoreductase subunit M